jgi:predicted nucleotidyltransferase
MSDMAEKKASGRFVLRLEPALHGRLRERARATGVSLNEYCARQLARPASAFPEPVEAVVRSAQEVVGEALAGVVAFGSWARGEATESSDVDVLIVIDDRVAVTRELYRRWDTSPLRLDGRAVEPHFVRLPDPDARPTGLWAEVAVDGIVLFDPEYVVSRRLARVRTAIAEGVVVRRRAHGQWYWVAA